MSLFHPSSRLSPDDPQLAHLINAERVRMLYAPTALMVGMSSVFSLALAVIMGPSVGWTPALIWAALCLMAGAVRLFNDRAYRRSKDRDDPRWLRNFVMACAVHGSCWGLAGILLMPVQDMVIVAVVVATLIGAGSISTFALQAHVAPNAAMNVPLMLPAALMLLTRMDTYGLFGAVGILSLGIVMLNESRRAERRISELLWLRFTTDRIAQERADALKLAQRHSAVKDQFLATMSHEMRTPLHGILGLSQLIQQRLPPKPGVLGDARQHAALIQRSGEHLLSLISDVLDFSRIEAGKLAIDHSVFDLRQVLDDVLALSRVTAAGKGLPLIEDVRLPRPCLVEGDAARLRQVLYNLLGNAIKFTDTGEIRLTVARRAAADGHGAPPIPGPAGDDPDQLRIGFEIADTGVGIPPDQIDRIFEAFQQLDNSFGRRHQGTGLGLTISREIARAMGGDITCQSAPGKGSLFTLGVPLRNAAPDAKPQVLPNWTTAPSATHDDIDTQPAQATAVDTREAPAPAHMMGHPVASQEAASPAPPPPLPQSLQGRVLLVEDNPVNALVAQAGMSQLGLDVTLVSDGQQALDLLVPGPHDFDLVLMDCQMPVLDGVETTRRLRAHEDSIGSPNVPVIALTANAMPQDRRRCAAAGMDDHLAKPFRQEELLAVLLRHLHPRQQVTA
jgi:signal transduction histidine kinase/ActR/RegA family two-component response regulator